MSKHNPRDRRKITVPIDDYSTLDFYDSVDSVITLLQKYKEQHKDKEQLSITRGYRFNYDETKYYYLTYSRLENDEEYDKRMAELDKQDEWKRSQYEALKKEFEGK